MKNEREKIWSNEIPESFTLKTRKTTLEIEVFPTAEKAKRSKQVAIARETGFSIIVGSSGIALAALGINALVSGLHSHDIDLISGGVIALVASTTSIRFTYDSVNAALLAKRQLNEIPDSKKLMARIDGYLSRVKNRRR